MTWAKPLIAAIAAMMMAIIPSVASAAPKPQLLPRWQKSGPGLTVDYAGWNTFLRHYGVRLADGRTAFAYARVSPADKAALSATVDRLEAVDVDRLSRPQQFAYWINLYNAATIEVVLGGYPTGSILNIRDGLLPTGPWDRKIVVVKGEKLSLNDIEHGILRPIFHDPRVHVAINCASVGCPDLALTAYEAATINAQLDAAARGYVNSARGFQIKRGGLVASRIFDWYGADFGGPKGVLAFARHHANANTARTLGNRTTIDRYEYDWSLNEAR